MVEQKSKNKDSLNDLEKASFSTLVLSISSSAIIHMGLDPASKEKKDLRIAQFNIDLLEVLKDKTKGNRTDAETKLIDQCLQDLRMHFIQSNK